MSARATQSRRVVPSLLCRTFRPGASSSKFIEVLLTIWLRDLDSTNSVTAIPPGQHRRPIAATHQGIDAREAVTFEHGGFRSPFGRRLAKTPGDLRLSWKEAL